MFPLYALELVGCLYSSNSEGEAKIDDKGVTSLAEHFVVVVVVVVVEFLVGG